MILSHKTKSIIGISYSAISWWACVLGGKHLPENYQALFFGLFFLISLLFHIKTYVEFLKPFLFFYFIAVFTGLIFDFILIKNNVMTGVGASLFGFPLWLLCMWFVFPLNFLHCFQKITKNIWISMAFGAIGAPLAYKAGPVFGILELNPYALYFISGLWTIYMLFIYWLLKRLPLN